MNQTTENYSKIDLELTKDNIESANMQTMDGGGINALSSIRISQKNKKEGDKMVKEELGSTLTAPFMTLSFMALLVIPHLKLSDMGLFDGDEFKFI